MTAIAALFVASDGPYVDAIGVDTWDINRDARKYDGPNSVIAHPPCERWGRYWGGGPNPKAARRELGDDDGCFASALKSVRKFGGVLEHPEASHAWKHFGLNKPARCGGWIPADDVGGYTCCVEQGHYGHPARKATWLYVFGFVGVLPELTWGPFVGGVRIDEGFNSKEQAIAARKSPGFVPCKRLSESQRVHTPIAFRDVLIGIARQCSVAASVAA